MSGHTAPELARSEPEKTALSAVQELSGADGPLERHGVRVFLIAERLAAERGVEIDRELLLVAALLHDIGLYQGASRGGVYVTDGAEFTADLLHPYGWDEDRLQRCFDAIERHRELRSQWDRGEEVELLRRADLVDLSAGVVDFGLPRRELRGLFREVPRDSFYREIGPRLAATAGRRPHTLPLIFFRA
ncbi:MAG: HD domain-containing protein [Solirubrobacterales bacterium]